MLAANNYADATVEERRFSVASSVNNERASAHDPRTHPIPPQPASLLGKTVRSRNPHRPARSRTLGALLLQRTALEFHRDRQARRRLHAPAQLPRPVQRRVGATGAGAVARRRTVK